MFDVFDSRLIVEGTLHLKTPMRIGTGGSTSAIESDNPVLKDVLGNPLIPGSSLKGAMRSFLESRLRAIEIDRGLKKHTLACDFLGGDPCIEDEAARSIKESKELSPEEKDLRLLSPACLLCRVFGSPYMAAKASIRDLPVIPVFWVGYYALRDGVAIDRDKGTAATGLKYDFEVVPAGTRFAFKMQVDNATPAELGLIVIGMHALKEEQIQIGGGRSRGLGWCSLIEQSFIHYTDPIAMLVGEGGGTVWNEETQRGYVGSFLELTEANSA